MGKGGRKGVGSEFEEFVVDYSLFSFFEDFGG